MITATEAVMNGAAWLDQVKPGWHTLVDLDDLDMGTCSRCVAGQVFADEAEDGTVGDIYDGYDYAGYLLTDGGEPYTRDTVDALTLHGFSWNGNGVATSAEHLQVLWTALITARQES